MRRHHHYLYLNDTQSQRYHLLIHIIAVIAFNIMILFKVLVVLCMVYAVNVAFVPSVSPV
jgi:hypothetical protein